MPNFPEIVSGVSPSIHPAALSQIREGMADGKDNYGEIRFMPAIAAAEEALTASYDFIASVNKAEKILDEIQNSKNPATRRQAPGRDGEIRSIYVGDVRLDQGVLRRVGEGDEELAEKVGQAFQKVARVIDKRRAEIASGIEHIEKEIAGILNPASERTRADVVATETQVRAHITALGSKAASFVTDRIGKRDIATARAVLNAPAFLSGLKDGDLPKIRALAEKTFAPDRSRQLEAHRKALVVVELAGSETMKRFTKTEARRNGKRADAKKAISMIGAGL